MDNKGHITAEGPGLYQIFRPSNAPAYPVVVDSPHSGRDYPADFAHACSRDALERAEDNQVDELLAAAPDQGATLLKALFPRTYIDVNRAEDDIEPALLSAPWPHPLRTSERAHAGIGLIRRLVHPGLPVYDRLLHPDEIRARIERHYRPYHRALSSLIDEAHYRFGCVWHIDAHSMPSGSLRGAAGSTPDFVLGDRDGTSCAIEFRNFLCDTLQGLGYRVAVNAPYKGVEIVRRYGQPAIGRHSIQLEINKTLYWNENENTRGIHFNAVQQDLTRLIAAACRYAAAQPGSLAAD